MKNIEEEEVGEREELKLEFWPVKQSLAGS